jgi:hypothetical protein
MLDLRNFKLAANKKGFDYKAEAAVIRIGFKPMTFPT